MFTVGTQRERLPSSDGLTGSAQNAENESLFLRYPDPIRDHLRRPDRGHSTRAASQHRRLDRQGAKRGGGVAFFCVFPGSVAFFVFSPTRAETSIDEPAVGTSREYFPLNFPLRTGVYMNVRHAGLLLRPIDATFVYSPNRRGKFRGKY